MKRQAWLDYIKLIAMTLVVVYHTPPRYDNAHEAALFNMGWTEAAATRLLEAHRLKPDDPEAPFNLAVLYATAKQPDYQEASKWYKIAINNGAQHDPGLDRVLGE